MAIDTFERNLEGTRRMYSLAKAEGALDPSLLEGLRDVEARYRAGIDEYYRLKALPFTPEVKAQMDTAFGSLEDLTAVVQRFLRGLDPKGRWGIRLIVP